MKLLREYTLDFIRRNRRSSMAVMVAILLSTTMLSMLCGFFWNIWADNLRLTKVYSGDWHGELYDETLGSQLETVYSFPTVETVMIKGGWECAKIDDPRRDYLVYRDANAEYWASMPEQYEIIEGRIPQKSGELALSKQYFENHPDLNIGDSITLPVGDRLSGGEVLEPRTMLQADEQFVTREEKTYTVVAKLDVTTASTLPAYTALGFLEEGEIAPDDKLTVYLRFQNIRDTYQELPKLAAAVGYQTDEYGEYLLRYNGGYMAKMLIFSEDFTISDQSIINLPLAFLVCGLLVVALFVLIIHNAFALSANSRLAQLGILASVGATPRQIKGSVIFEGFILSVLPLPIGIVLGGGLQYWLIAVLNGYRTDPDPRMEIVFEFGLPVILPAMLFALLTVWMSASLPAKKVSRLSPIDAIRRSEGMRLKKAPRPVLGRLFGLEGELAAASLAARRPAFRTATISLTLSVLVLGCLLNIMACRSGAAAVYGKDEDAPIRDISLWINDGQPPEQTFLQEVSQLEGLSSMTVCGILNTALWVEPSRQSAEFIATGGLESVVGQKKYYPIQREGSYRVQSSIVGLSDDSFNRYCADLGIDPAPYYNPDAPLSIVYNLEEDVQRTTKRTPVLVPYLALSVGDTLTLMERRYDDDEGDGSFSVKVGHLADRLPQTTAVFSRYTLEQVMPTSVLRQAIGSFTQMNQSKLNQTRIILKCVDREQVATVYAALNRITDKWYGSGDYDGYDVNEIEESNALTDKMGNAVTGGVTLLLAVIGLSNVWATVSATLRSRRRELAMLRSMGLSPQGLRRMLSLEAVLFTVTPLLLSLPLNVGVLAAFLYINEITLMEYLPFAPIVPLLLLVGLILVVVATAYVTGCKRLQKEDIIDAIKDETV